MNVDRRKPKSVSSLNCGLKESVNNKRQKKLRCFGQCSHDVFMPAVNSGLARALLFFPFCFHFSSHTPDHNPVRCKNLLRRELHETALPSDLSSLPFTVPSGTPPHYSTLSLFLHVCLYVYILYSGTAVTLGKKILYTTA